MHISGIPVQFHGMDQAKALHFAASVSELTRSTRDFLSDVHKRTMDPHNDAEVSQ